MRYTVRNDGSVKVRKGVGKRGEAVIARDSLGYIVLMGDNNVDVESSREYLRGLTLDEIKDGVNTIVKEGDRTWHRKKNHSWTLKHWYEDVTGTEYAMYAEVRDDKTLITIYGDDLELVKDLLFNYVDVWFDKDVEL